MPFSRRTHSITPIFIGGTGRSGTTVLGDLLNEHSQVRTSNPTEIKFLANRAGLLDVIFGPLGSHLEKRQEISPLHVRTYRQRQQRDFNLRQERFKDFQSRLWEKWWEIDAPAPHGPGLHAGIDKARFVKLLNRYEKGLGKNPTKQAERFLQSFIDSQSGHKGERFWAETTPMNISYSHRLIKVFPKAKFIVVRRDPCDVIASLLTKDWGPNSALEGVDWIEKRLRADHQALASVPKDQVLFIQLEDLVSLSRESSYQKILEFLELDNEPGMSAFHTNTMTAENAASGRWKNEIDTPEFNDAISAMKKRLLADSII